MKRYRKIAVLVCSVLIWIGIALPQESKFEEGEKYLKERNYAKAIGIFREILDRPGWDELSPKAALRLGQCYLALKDYENARRFFNEAMEWGGDIVGEANIGIAITYINEKKYDQAIEVLSNIISQYKTDTILAYAYFNRGLAYEGKKWIGKALNDFVKAKEKAKDDEELLAAIDGELKKCRSLQQQFLREEDEYLQKIRSAQGMGDWDGCAGLLRELAKVCEDWGEMELAIDYERKAGAYSSSEEFKAGSLMNIAWRYYKIKDYEKAADAFKQVGEGYPQSSYAKEALLHLGEVYADTGKYDSAIQAFEQLIRKYGGKETVKDILVEAEWYIGHCYEHKYDFPNALESYSHLVKSYSLGELTSPTAQGSWKDARFNIGYCYLQLGEYEKAFKVWEQILKERTKEGDQDPYYVAGRVLDSYKRVIIPSAQIIKERKGKGESRLVGPICGIFMDYKLELREQDRIIVVYGTQSENTEENIACKELAGKVKEYLGELIPCKKDSAVSEEEIKEKNLVLIGSPRSNKILASLSKAIPIDIGEETIQVANRVYKGKDIGVIMIAPHPLNKDAFVLVYSAFDPYLLRNILSVYQGGTDYIVFSKQSLGDTTEPDPNKPALEEGYFFKAPDKWVPFPSEKHNFVN